MTVREIIEKLSLDVLVGENKLDENISSGYVSDLLSNVMGQVVEKSVWVTMQGHQNVVAVASLGDVSAIIIAGGASIDDETIKKATENDVVLLSSQDTVFNVAGKLYELGLRGNIK